MLALAATPSHDHSSAYSSTVTTAVSASQTVRAKLHPRHPPSAAALRVVAKIPTSSSNSVYAPPKLVRGGGVLRPRPHSEVEHDSKPPAQHGTQQTKMSNSHHSQEANLPPAIEVPSGPPMPLQLKEKFDIDELPTIDLLRNLAAFLTEKATENDAKTSHIPDEPRLDNTESTVLESLFTASQAAFSSKSSRMAFHARNIPTIALEDYLLRILRYCPSTNEVFLSLLIYFDRISKLSEEAAGTQFIIDSYNVHRLVMAGVTVASKFFSDVFYTNSRYAKVGGLPLAELNQLELQFLLLIDFRLVVSSNEMEHYARQLAQYSQRKPGSTPMQFKSVSEPLPPAPLMMPSRPMHSMGAFDAFGGNVQNDQVIQRPGVPAQKNATPKRTTLINNNSRTAPQHEPSEERDQESSAYSETDTDAETDDEPTIKPSHSCGSSDTQSLFSNDASEASFGNNQDDEEGNSTDGDHKTPERERSHHTRWDSRESTAVDDNRHMASP